MEFGVKQKFRIYGLGLRLGVFLTTSRFRTEVPAVGPLFWGVPLAGMIAAHLNSCSILASLPYFWSSGNFPEPLH